MPDQPGTPDALTRRYVCPSCGATAAVREEVVVLTCTICRVYMDAASALPASPPTHTAQEQPDA